MDPLRFYVNDRLIEEANVSPTTTLLDYLRERLHLSGTKEGCAEGDCGACTVALLEPRDGGAATYRAVNSCLLLLPMLQGRRVYTVEGLRRAGLYHPVQEALVRAMGSQCGYCTPGVVMSMFEACYRDDLREPWQQADQLCGNLCRCTGYRPILQATAEVAGLRPADRFQEVLDQAGPRSDAAFSVHYQQGAQRYFNPTSLSELFRLLGEHADARLIAGGTDLGLLVTKKFQVLPCLVSLEGIGALRRIERDARGWRLGAAATLTEVQEATGGELVALEKMLRVFASRQIRNRATLGGNLCNASPVGDLAPVLLALGAEVTLASAAGERVMPLEEFFLSYRQTALGRGEVLHSVFVPHPPIDARSSSFKVSKRRELDISAVSAGCFVRVGVEGVVREARLAYGGMAAIPARARHAEAALVGAPWVRASLDGAMAALEQDFQPISDVRGSAWYRLQVAKNLLLGFFAETREHPAPTLQDHPTSTVQAEVTP